MNAGEMSKNMPVPEQSFVGQLKLLAIDRLAKCCLVKMEQSVSEEATTVFTLLYSYANISILDSHFAVNTTTTNDNKLFDGIRLFADIA